MYLYYNFYGLFTAYLLYEEVMSVRLYVEGFFGFKHAVVLTDTWILKNCCQEHFWRTNFMENERFFSNKNSFKKCVLSQIELIRHCNKKTNFITTCLNFKFELTKYIRNRNSIFVGLVYPNAYWLRSGISFMIQGHENKDIKNVLVNNIKYI